MKVLRPWIALAFAGAVLVYGAVFNLRHSSRLPSNRALPVRVVAHEWWWEFDYPTLGITTSDALHLPSHEKVRLELHSGDIIHSFWIDGMRKPIELPPGKTEHLDLDVKSPGELHGNCDAGCGCGTVCMRFRVVASAPKDFDSWVVRQRAAPSRMTARNTTPPACALDKNVDHRESPQPSRPDSPPIQGLD
jgi:heme/copper-type cytochrome/quinol oxidase subunit 2